jgi:purine-nucleoside phosphorylase
MTSSTNSHVNRLRFNGMDYAPPASFDLLLAAYRAARERGARVHVGGILASDTFYGDDPDSWKQWAEFGVLAVEMETSTLYTLAAKFKIRALSVLTVSDSLATREFATAAQRERGFPQMAEIALQIAP